MDAYDVLMYIFVIMFIIALGMIIILTGIQIRNAYRVGQKLDQAN